MNLRRELSREFAVYFIFHLREELKKPSEVTDYITLEGESFRTQTENMIDDLKKVFPNLQERIPLFNFFKQWWNRQRVNVNSSLIYENSTFKAYNQMFFFRIMDIRFHENSLRKKFTENMKNQTRMIREKGRLVTFEMLFQGELVLYPILELMLKRSRLPFREGRKILYEQSSFIQKAAYEVIDSELRDSLARTDSILKAILPEKIAEELKQKKKVQPKLHNSISIMFCDLAGFTEISSRLAPEDLLRELNECFGHFDKITSMLGLEKIKTIGDSYMAAAGLNDVKVLHSVNSILAASRIHEFLRKYAKSQNRKGLPAWQVRIGIHTGPAVAGILGENRFNYDIWGDSVNVAQRMESYGEAGRINVSREAMESASDFFIFEEGRTVNVKGKGMLEMFFVKSIKPELSLNGSGKTPSAKFKRLYESVMNPEAGLNSSQS
ncbi:MAG TPA: adenylate/guanylate cyclase domain-containing protein [Leptospiraceae bacterium]|nr:adenylate/guanylate cyclase domain-containing protein [Leptospiraceae bacterium]HNF23321.1 adenylate/guanylate cyclase domain-containing protein [Leptospiraceae bacterium]HNN04121.1 adenylate/guanylate cyclase domain-containing protein [Leptospiraceae bacterium]